MTQKAITLRSSDEIKSALANVSTEQHSQFYEDFSFYAGSGDFTAHELGVDLFNQLYNHTSLDQIHQLVNDGTVLRWIQAVVTDNSFADNVLAEFNNRLNC